MGKANEQAKDKPSLLNRWLNGIEKVGNKLPKPFFAFCHQNAVPSPFLSYFAIMAMLIRINTIKTRDRPLPKCQLFPFVNSCSITLPISRILLPPRREEITKVVSAGTNTMVIPLITPGRLSGKIIRQNVFTLLAPRSLAALIRS